ncbi:hypothetical protein ACFY94_03530 [Streptomyces griseorubiginosus]|uniref:hypothetical protein n=1 Tax=Streptomyces griseorubiginosus TaxID=67304 RepID=UPI0036ED7D5C
MTAVVLFGSRTGFGLEFHVERDPSLLCVDVFVGGLQVNTWDNAFYPPLLVKKLKEELARFRTPGPRPLGPTSPTGEALARWEFLEWGECTDQVIAFASPDGDLVHLTCRIREEAEPDRGTVARCGSTEVSVSRGEPAEVSVSRTALVETLESALALAEREWSARLAALTGRTG